MFNKPRGYITAMSDPRRPVIKELFPKEISESVFPVGRLDMDTEGLLILTDDGSVCHFLMDPRSKIPKTYHFMALGEPSDDGILKLRSGVKIYNTHDFVTSSADIELLSYGVLSEHTELLSSLDMKKHKKHISSGVFFGNITITEGKKHQVRRMLRGIGCPVLYLKRISIGSLYLDPTLPLGDCRELTKEELGLLLK